MPAKVSKVKKKLAKRIRMILNPDSNQNEDNDDDLSDDVSAFSADNIENSGQRQKEDVILSSEEQAKAIYKVEISNLKYEIG